jgi:hypothetical protein
VDSNSTRSRADRAQLSVLLDAGLVAILRLAARERGMSIVAFVEGALEVALDGYVDVGAGGSVGSSEESVGVRAERGRDRVYGSVSAVDGRGVIPDWDAFFAAGRASKVSSVAPVAERVIDPIEEIA